jgi:hypothetical protein
MPRAPAHWVTTHMVALMPLASAVLALAILGCVAPGPIATTPANSGCCTHPPTAAPSGIPVDEAIAIAFMAAGSSATVEWATVDENPFQPRNEPRDLVWVVRLAGDFASPCPSGYLDVPPSPSSPPCLSGDGMANVVIDYFSGRVLGWDQ